MRPRFVLVLLVAAPIAAQVKLTQQSDRIDVEVGGQIFTTFYYGPQAPKPYLHPLRSASGKIVTRRYPMEEVAGEARDHPHHRGLWFTHGDVNGFDFWANEPSQRSPKKGRVTLKRIVEVNSGKESGTVQAQFDWLDPAGTAIVGEARTMTFYSHPTDRVIDFDIRLTAVGKTVFGDTKEGTFAIRVATSLEEKHTGKMVSAEGKITEKAVWGTRSPWVDYAGEVDGEKIGIAIFDHPSSTRHPTYWHSRAYGLFAANAFGLHDFLRDKSADGSLKLEPAESARFRYRVLIHSGDVSSASLAEQYSKYAAKKL